MNGKICEIRIPFIAVFVGALVACFVLLLTAFLCYGLAGTLWSPLLPIICSVPAIAPCFFGILTVRCFAAISVKQAAKLSVAYIVVSTIWIAAFGIDAAVTLLLLYPFVLLPAVAGGVMASVLCIPDHNSAQRKGGHVTTK